VCGQKLAVITFDGRQQRFHGSPAGAGLQHAVEHVLVHLGGLPVEEHRIASGFEHVIAQRAAHAAQVPAQGTERVRGAGAKQVAQFLPAARLPAHGEIRQHGLRLAAEPGGKRFGPTANIERAKQVNL
jgi:hypothetical protein